MTARGALVDRRRRPAPVPTLAPPDLVNLAGTDTGRDHLSHSAIGTLLGCQQRFYWHYERRLDPNVKAAPLLTGAAFADALEAGDPDVAWATVLNGHDALVAEFGGDPWVVVPERETAEIQAQVARCAARAYLDRYGQHAETREHEIRVRLRNPHTGAMSRTFDLVGRVDAVSHDYRTMIEDKLVGQIPRRPGDLERKLRLDRQVSIGCYLIWRSTGVMVREVRYRMTLKPGIRRTKTESHDGYLERIASEYQSRPDHYLVEQPCARRSDDFLRLELELWRWAEQVRDARRDGVFPRNTAACQDFAGCTYLSLCADEPGAVHQFHIREQRAA
jgi:hypothetical protein